MEKGTNTLHITRRMFIGGLAAIGSGSLFSPPLLSVSHSDHIPTRNQILQVLTNQSNAAGFPVEYEEIENLEFAYQTIKPKTHTEAAIVAWAGSQLQPVGPIIEEFCRRKNNLPPQMFDHEVLNLRNWCCPHSQRILIFREQLESLSLELTSKRNTAADIYAHELGIDDFIGRLNKEYRNTFLDNEIEGFYCQMRDMYATSRTYTWCSTVVERALAA